METTNSVFDQKLLSENTSPQTLLSWQRAMLGNWFAGGGREWVETFEKENSGTYNNQFMVVDKVDLSLSRVIFKTKNIKKRFYVFSATRDPLGNAVLRFRPPRPPTYLPTYLPTHQPHP